MDYKIDNTLTPSQNMEGIKALIGELPNHLFISSVSLLGGGGKYGRQILGIKGISISKYTTISTPHRKLTTKNIKTTKTILVNKDYNLDIDKIKRVIQSLALS